MLELLLRGYLVYISFVQPVIYGAQLCNSPSPDPLQVTNVTLTLIYAWLLEVADVLFLSSFIAMRWLYLAARIVLALYFAHPRFLGAVQVYRKLFIGLVDTYGPVFDSLVVRHVQTIGELGVMQCGARVSSTLLRGVAAVANIAKALLESSTTTTVPAAALPRRMSQARPETDHYEAHAGEAHHESRTAQTATPSPPSQPVRSPPLLWQSPVLSHADPFHVPPSLYTDSETQRTASTTVSYNFEPQPQPPMQRPLWDERDDDEDAPLVPLGRYSRGYREPDTVVNRASHKPSAISPFDN